MSPPGIQRRIGADGCAAMDVNTACTSFLYSLSTATAMIRTGVVSNALVIGSEIISPFMDWSDRNVAVLFGDGAAAVVLKATDHEEGLLAERLGCYGEAREILRVHGMGAGYAHQDRILGQTEWQFEGQEIFKKAVHGMSMACAEALTKLGKTAADIDLVVPHQANLRIIEAVAKKTGVPMSKRVHQRGSLRKHVGGDGSGGVVRGDRRRTRQAGRAAAHAVVRWWAHLHGSCSALGPACDAARHQQRLTSA